MPRRALVLSGGGAKGSFQIGALEELILNKGLDFEILCGVSVGALNASFLAQAPFDPANPDVSRDNLKNAFRTLRRVWLEEITGSESVYRVRPGDTGGIVLGADSIYDPEPLQELLERYLKPQELAQSNRVLRVQYVSLKTGELRTADSQDPNIVKYVLASATMPYYFPPVKVRGEHLVDGGVRDITPLGQAFAAGAEVIYVIYATPFDVERAEFVDNWVGTRVNALNYLARGAEIMINEIYRTDTEGAQRFNTLKEHWEQVKPLLPPNHPSRLKIDEVLQRIRFAPILEIRPERHIIRESLNFSPVDLQENYLHGREVAGRLQQPLP